MTQEPIALNDAAQANLTTGVLMLCKEALVTAIQDRRLERGHLRVLAAMVSFMNSRTAKAWPSRSAIADMLGMQLKTVSNILHELRGFGYLIAEKQAVEEANNRKLTVYTFGNIDHEQIRKEITAFVNKVRDARAKEEKAEKVPAHGEDPVPRPRGTSPPTGTNSGDLFPAHGAGSSPPAGRRNSEKKLNPIGAENSAQTQPAQSLKSVIWLHGIGYLVRTYNGSKKEDHIRSRLGLLIKEHGQGMVMHALGCAEQAAAVDPLDFMTGMLRTSNPVRALQNKQAAAKGEADVKAAYAKARAEEEMS